MADESEMTLASFGVCLAARKCVVDKQMGADPHLPGPGAYVNPMTEGRNGNGEVKAKLSSQKNVPSVVFGNEGLKEKGRPVEKQLNSGDRIGPKYQLDNITHGKQVQSRLRSAPSATFGSGPQRYHGGSDFKARIKEPSPQQYDTERVSAAVFRLSTKRNIPGTKFTTGPRTYNDANARRNKALPAPGQYRAQSAIGKQVESKYIEHQSFTIHGGRRDFVKASAQNEPGPGAYVDPIKEGRNASGECKAVLSSQRSCPSAVFTKSQQRPNSAPYSQRLEKRPGPCQYKVQAAIGKQTSSRYKSCPSFSFGSR